MRWVLRLLINAAALFVAVKLVPGLSYEGGPVPFLAVALVFGVINTVLKPLLTILSLPAVILTLGLFLLIINALMLWLTSALSGALGLGFHVAGFAPALLGSVVVSLVAWAISAFVEEHRH